ncbi:MAG: hypothetical protein ABEJ76_06625 [Halanaeroarchaeum sp.]
MTLRQTADLLETESYPMTADELTTNLGDHRMSLPNGEERLATVIERSGVGWFGSANEAREAVYGAVSDKAIGRHGYSDRDPSPMGVDDHEPVSF